MSKPVPDPDFDLTPWKQMVTALYDLLGSGHEIVLHDLRLMPNTLVAVSGDLTGRKIGAPMTDLLLAKLSSGKEEDSLSYSTRSEDGRLLRCSTVFIRDANGVPVGCLCLNKDMTHLLSARDALDKLINDYRDDENGLDEAQTEVFPHNVDNLQDSLVKKSIAKVGIPVDLMKKEQKKAIVAELQDSGFFLIRDSVDRLAAELDVTRFTIYNYLKELENEKIVKDRKDHSSF
ncbi:PAS domain-containing protein [Bifidobacterium sp. ESL0775]|uniref:helix-turn-helix transcriptional regulator n=1 Tax=Bifidobacterium sp. ESL0775 TaxID=2983230 RepID=UPI0023F8F981|nr:PAS domain-containing protein [Bifidobacterium sp. ESL0775]WEV69204.1 PAS domain-containing protein [Bifidobacterium sp. ESL0775]